MGHSGGSRHGTKPRPLGQVKKESLSLGGGSSSTGRRQTTFLSEASACSADIGPALDGGKELDVPCLSMRVFQKNLGHAALLNIVASANKVGMVEDSAQQDKCHLPDTACARSAQPLHHMTLPSSRTLEVTDNDADILLQGLPANGWSERTAEQKGTRLPKTQHENPRPRTVPNLRPCRYRLELPIPFQNKAELPSADCLSSKGEVAPECWSTDYTSSTKRDSEQRAVSMLDAPGPVRGHALDAGDDAFNQRITPKGCSAVSGTLSLDLCASAQRQSTSTASSASSRSTTEVCRTSDEKAAGARPGKRSATGTGKAVRVRRHLSLNKRRALVKQLTEAAGAKDSFADGDSDIVLPMTILSQQRHKIHHPEDSLAVTRSTTTYNLVDSNVSRNELHRPLTSFSPHKSSYLTRTKSAKVQQAQNKSELDLSTTGNEKERDYTTDAQKLERCNTTEQSQINELLFTEGIVGKTIGKEQQASGKELSLECKPFYLSSLPERPRCKTTIFGCYSSSKLKDCRPQEPVLRAVSVHCQTPQSPKASSLTTEMAPEIWPSKQKFSLEIPPEIWPSRQKHSSEIPQELSSSKQKQSHSTKSLPLLTIIGLNGKKQDSEPVEDSTPFTPKIQSMPNMSSNRVRVLNQLDKQCQKLQKRLSMSLKVSQSGQDLQCISASDSLPRNTTSDISASLQDGTSKEGQDNLRQTCFTRTSRLPPALERTEAQSIERTEALSIVEDLKRFMFQTRNEVQIGPGKHRQLSDLHQKQKRQKGSANVKRDSNTKAAHRQNNRDTDMEPDIRMGLPSKSLDPEDPVLKSLKEPRCQGYSSRVPESQSRSQFHYIKPISVEETAEAQDAKYRVFKALDQDVYYQFQHRKYRKASDNSSAVKYNNQEDNPRVHFYKVKVAGES